MEKRPAVVRMFYKNGHNYRKDYGVGIDTLGSQIMEWWAEISPPSGVPSIRFGGPMGIYSLVVLMSWWCTRLKDKSDEERVDCLRLLKDIDRVLSTTVNDMKSHRTSSTFILSPTTPPLSSQLRKRVISEEMTPRKRTRTKVA